MAGESARVASPAAGDETRAAARFADFIERLWAQGDHVFPALGHFDSGDGNEKWGGATFRGSRGHFRCIDHILVPEWIRSQLTYAGVHHRARLSRSRLDHLCQTLSFQIPALAARRRVQARPQFPRTAPLSAETAAMWRSYGRGADAAAGRWAAAHPGVRCSADSIGTTMHTAAEEAFRGLARATRDPGVTAAMAAAAIAEGALIAVKRRERNRARRQYRQRRAAHADLLAQVVADTRRRNTATRRGVRTRGFPVAAGAAHLAQMYGSVGTPPPPIDGSILRDITHDPASLAELAAMDVPVTLREFRAEVGRLRRVTAGCDGLTADHLRQMPQGGAMESAVFQMVVDTFTGTRGTDGETSLTACVIYWLYKKRSRLEPKNYRTIGVQSMLRKIVQGLILRRIRPLIERFLHGSQGAYRARRGADDAALLLHLMLRRGMLSGVSIVLALLDIIKAFDTTSSVLVLSLLRALALPPAIINVLQGLYGQATYAERLDDGSLGAYCHFLMGLPQGDVLSGIFFGFVLEYTRRITLRDVPAHIRGDRLFMDATLPVLAEPRLWTRQEESRALRRQQVARATDVLFASGRDAGPSRRGHAVAVPVADITATAVISIALDLLMYADDTTTATTTTASTATLTQGFGDSLSHVSGGHLQLSAGIDAGSKMGTVQGGAAGTAAAIAERRPPPGANGRPPTRWLFPHPVLGLPAWEHPHVDFVGTCIEAGGELDRHLRTRMGMGDTRCAVDRAQLGPRSELSRAGRIELFIESALAVVMAGASLWVLSVSAERSLDYWFLSRMATNVLGMRGVQRAGGFSADMASVLHVAEQWRGKPIRMPSALVVERRAGHFGRVLREIAAAQSASTEPPYHAIAAFSSAVRPARQAAAPPLPDDTRRIFLSCGIPGDWRARTMEDMAVLGLSLEHALAPGSWKRAFRRFPDMRHYVMYIPRVDSTGAQWSQAISRGSFERWRDRISRDAALTGRTWLTLRAPADAALAATRACLLRICRGHGFGLDVAAHGVARIMACGEGHVADAQDKFRASKWWWRGYCDGGQLQWRCGLCGELGHSADVCADAVCEVCRDAGQVYVGHSRASVLCPARR